MKNKKFNQTVVFTSESSEIFRRELVAGNTPEEPLVEQLTPIVTNTDESPVIDHPEQFTETAAVQPPSAVNDEVQVSSTPLSTDKLVPTPQTPVPKLEINMTSSSELRKQRTNLRPDIAHQVQEPPKQKVYDRFKRTVEVETLQLFEGDSQDIGAAWMIREKDDVIEHRERLGLDNNEFYKDQFPLLTFILLVLCLIGVALWYSQSSHKSSSNHIEVIPTQTLTE